MGLVIGGIDEAGRGAALGPLVLAIALVEKEDEEKLVSLGVTDSKLLLPAKRERLFHELPSILVEHAVFSIEPAEIDALMAKESLNEIEAMVCARLLNGLAAKPDLVILDSPDGDAKRFASRVKNYLSKSFVLRSEHKADLNHRVVGAASILAKVTRDRAIMELSKKWGEMGSGYPSDPRTMLFLKQWLEREGSLPVFARAKWASNIALINRKNQSLLGDFDGR